jgi:hypothetical protein
MLERQAFGMRIANSEMRGSLVILLRTSSASVRAREAYASGLVCVQRD